jgi:hypothetical protein
VLEYGRDEVLRRLGTAFWFHSDCWSPANLIVESSSMDTRWPLLLLFFLLVGGCFQQDKNRTSQLLPLDYQQSYSLVRGCRLIRGHDANSIVVLANAEARADYVAGNSPLPQGSVIVAVESDKTDCSSVTGFTLMFKDVKGYDPTAADWHWQRLDDLRNVLDDGRVQACIGCHAQCQRVDYTCSPP